jgi:hypothetical protein
MSISGKATDRLTSMVIYAALGGLALWAGTKLINNSLDSKFHKDFLLKWEVVLRTFNQQGGTWPRFSGGNHILYMEKLIRLMQSKGLPPPDSNAGHPFVYLLDKIGAPEEKIFILCFPQRIILYGISAETFARLDKSIDGKTDPKRGMFKGRQSKDGRTYIGVWQI